MGPLVARRGRKKKDPPVRLGETATKERRRHDGGVVTEVVERDPAGNAYIKRQRAYSECRLEMYFRRNYLAEPEFRAGMKFREVYLRHLCGIRLGGSYAPYLNERGHADAEGRVMAGLASERVLQAAYGALSEKQKEIVRSVCGHDQSAMRAARILTLKRGLEKLATLWHFV